MLTSPINGQCWCLVVRRGCFNIVLLVALLLGWMSPAFAVNWFMLQGTEPAGAAAMRLGGFAALVYQNNGSGKIPGGCWAGQHNSSGLVGPNLRSSAETNLNKLQLCARGAIEDDISYSVRVLAGNNSGTAIDSGNRLRLIETSMTFSQVPGVRARLGLFKTPGAEETAGFVAPVDYIKLTTMSKMLQREKFVVSDGSDPHDDNYPTQTGCCRDFGLMLFDAFKMNNWELSYAVMLGQGHGLNLHDENSNPEGYFYCSAEYLFGRGQQMQRQGWKFFGWGQEGQRTLEVGLAHTKLGFRRSRYGGGSSLLWRDLRLGAEFIQGRGMIVAGVDSSVVSGSLSNDGNMLANYNVAPEGQAFGWSVDAGYQLLSQLWLNVRYDRLDALTESIEERQMKTLTLGVSYWFNQHLQGMVNYSFQSGRAPHKADDALCNLILDEINDTYAVQLLYKF